MQFKPATAFYVYFYSFIYLFIFCVKPNQYGNVFLSSHPESSHNLLNGGSLLSKELEW